MTSADDDDRFMARALELAVQGRGLVEPNPPVGCVIVRDGRIVGEGFHERFGGPHAEVVALRHAGAQTAGATAYVTLEPCCHHGKTPPCTDALIEAGVARVVAAVDDPFPEVHGQGIAALEAAGIACEVGVCSVAARRLLAPYLKLITTGRPWVIAKWAMTLDGKMATRTGDSRWISSEVSRRVVHQLRGRVDAILVGSGTAWADNPLLTSRPANRGDIRRIATRVVVDSAASLSLDSRLVQTAHDVPLIVAVGQETQDETLRQLTGAGAEVYRCGGRSHQERIAALLDELGRRRMTNVLVEGGSRLLGTFFDMRAIDEVHVFIAPKMIGGNAAISPIGGEGVDRISDALRLAEISIEELDGDLYIHGRIHA